MRTTLRWAVLVSALAAGVIPMICGPAGAAGAASTGSSAPAAARSAAEGMLGNYQISGIEDAIGCLTAHRCVAVGFGGGHAPAQVVTIAGGKQVGVSIVRSVPNLDAVSCPSRAGCWAMGRQGHNWALVKIGPTGKVTGLTTVKVAAGAYLDYISCTTMKSCEIFGTSVWNVYLARWNGRRLSLRYTRFGHPAQAVPGGISCWQTSCLAVAGWNVPGSGETTGADFQTIGGSPAAWGFALAPEGFAGVSCVSSSTCYVETSSPTDMVLTLSVQNFQIENAQNEPVYLPEIECAGATCWAAGNSAAGPAEFVMMTDGVPGGSPLTDPALIKPSSIARRGDGFAAVGRPATPNGGVSEVVTN